MAHAVGGLFYFREQEKNMVIKITDKWRKQMEADSLRKPKPASTTLTDSAENLLRYYRSLGQEQFYRSLDRIAAESGLNKKTVQRANDCLRDLGLLSWLQGFGNRSAGIRSLPNMYVLAPNGKQ